MVQNKIDISCKCLTMIVIIISIVFLVLTLIYKHIILQLLMLFASISIFEFLTNNKNQIQSEELRYFYRTFNKHLRDSLNFFSHNFSTKMIY